MLSKIDLIHKSSNLEQSNDAISIVQPRTKRGLGKAIGDLFKAEGDIFDSGEESSSKMTKVAKAFKTTETQLIANQILLENKIFRYSSELIDVTAAIWESIDENKARINLVDLQTTTLDQIALIEKNYRS